MDTLEILSLLAAVGFVVHWFNRREQRKRTVLLASHLFPLEIERLMKQLTEGYMRALNETDAERQIQVLQLQHEAEQEIARQVQALADAFGRLPAPQARTPKLALPGLDKVLPQSTFDTRLVLQIHADGIESVVRNEDGLSPRDRAFTLMAEMFLMQHSCHWFCRSKSIASARMLALHKTRYEQALAAVTHETRKAYLSVINGPALG